MSTLADHPDYSLYSNASTFLRQALDHKPAQSNADVVVTGLPFDLATTGRPGARLGPDAVRRASVNLAWEETRWPWHFKLFEQLTMIDAGDLVFDCGEQQQFTQRLESYAKQLLEAGKTMLSLGGGPYRYYEPTPNTTVNSPYCILTHTPIPIARAVTTTMALCSIMHRRKGSLTQSIPYN